jgi:hypothetical protein
VADAPTGPRPLDRRRLGIYLNDHLAGAAVALDLAKRSLASNGGTEHGRALERLVVEIGEDSATLRDVMRRLGVPEQAYKLLVARVGERLGRLKPNGQLRGYSPLSRLLELDVLQAGLQGKESLWRSLALVAGGEPALRDVDLDRLVVRARAQQELLEARRAPVAGEALGAATAPMAGAQGCTRREVPE